MYLGFKEQGLQLMGTFFLCLFIMDWMRMTFMIFLIPIIWFYSMFDALQKTSQNAGTQQDDFVLSDWLNQNHRLLAYLLIGLGLLLIVNKFLFGLVMWQYNEYIQTVVVSLLLIFGGIKLLRGTRIKDAKAEFSEEIQMENDQEALNEAATLEEECAPEKECSSDAGYEAELGAVTDSIAGEAEEDV